MPYTEALDTERSAAEQARERATDQAWAALDETIRQADAARDAAREQAWATLRAAREQAQEAYCQAIHAALHN